MLPTGLNIAPIFQTEHLPPRPFYPCPPPWSFFHLSTIFFGGQPQFCFPSLSHPLFPPNFDISPKKIVTSIPPWGKLLIPSEWVPCVFYFPTTETLQEAPLHSLAVTIFLLFISLVLGTMFLPPFLVNLMETFFNTPWSTWRESTRFSLFHRQNGCFPYKNPMSAPHPHFEPLNWNN